MSHRRIRFHGAAGQVGTIAVTLLGLLVLTFFIGRLMPVDPVRAIVGEEADPAKPTNRCTSSSASTGRSTCSSPIISATSLTGDFGTSLRTGQPVIEDILACHAGDDRARDLRHPDRRRARHAAGRPRRRQQGPLADQSCGSSRCSAIRCRSSGPA